MKLASALFMGTTLSLVVISLSNGFYVAITVATGAVVTMALSISATFFWLWRARATPLALGMGFSWIGTAGVLGWWWLYNRLGAPSEMLENELLFVFVSAYFVGAILHFEVIVRSLGRRSVLLFVPVVLFLGCAFMI